MTTQRPRLLEAWRRQAQARVISALVASVPPREQRVLVPAQDLVPGDWIMLGNRAVRLQQVEESFAGTIYMSWGGLLDCQIVSHAAELELVR